MTHPPRFLLPFDEVTASLPVAGQILLSAPPDMMFGDLPRGRVVIEQRWKPLHDRLKAAGWTAAPVVQGTHAAAIVFLPRQRAEALGRIARAAMAVEPGGLLVIDGAKTDGIDGVLKQVRALLPLEGVLAKAHGKVAWARLPAELPADLTRWSAALDLSRNADGMLTAPGMFSPDRIDPGSAALIAHLPVRTSGLAADLGAGWGAVAGAVLARAPGLERLDLFEADFAALEAARLNVTDPRARHHWADVAGLGIGHGPYDLVVANPPFHHGRAADPALGAAFISAAARILSRGGSFLMVANRQLPYERRLDEEFGVVEVVETSPAFKVIAAREPKAARRR
jgi:16S rRNA (guanine1207-N2)-methyltransferase